VSYQWQEWRGPEGLDLNRQAESLQALYQRYGAALTAYACSYGLNFASAEDVVQQLFLKLLRDGNEMQAPAAYLHRAVRNAALNLKRTRARETELQTGVVWLTHAAAEPAEIVALQDALRQLPEEQRETVFLRVWSGMTLQEIADTTDLPLNTVASRYRYALEKLRLQLGQRFEERAGHEKRGAGTGEISE